MYRYLRESGDQNALLMNNTTRKLLAETSAKIDCKPFLKWVGGKSQLLPELIKRLPTISGKYFEPFIGGGALLFALQPRRAFISDVNPELMNCYEVVRDQVLPLINHLKRHRYEHDYYYDIRDIDRLPAFQRWSAIKRASRLIFLNKTCFNGLYRVNSRGEFNVPFGRYTNPSIVDPDNLKACSSLLQSVTIKKASFLEIENRVRPGDFVYFDPPYVPLSATSTFTAYSRERFDSKMQHELFQLCNRLNKKGVQFMLSNSSAPFVRTLYKKFRVELVSANRAINSKGDKRGSVKEVIVRNY